MLFATMREPPRPGSPRESVLLIYALKREMIEHYQFKALAQLVLNKEVGTKAYDEYVQFRFPWIEGQKKRDAAEHIKLLMEEIKRGGLSIKPLWETKVRSRLKKTAPPSIPGSSRGALYDKLGRTIPI